MSLARGDEAAQSDGSRERRAAAALTFAALVPVIVTVVTRAGRRYVPVGDIALIDLRVRDVWSHAIPLVGPYSRLGWNHPGPAMFWLLAPLSFVTGRPAWATLVGGALLQGAAIVAIGRLAWRKGGLRLVAAALALNGLAYGAMGPSTLLEAWNPNVTFPFLIVLVLQVWCIADGDVARLPFAVAVGVFLVQTHVGYLTLVVAALLFGIGGAVLRSRRRVGDRVRWGRPLLWSSAIFVVAWLPPVVQEFAHADNFAPMWRSLFGNNVALGPRAAAGIFGAEFRPPPPWLGGHTRLDPFVNTVVPARGLYVLAPIVLLAIAAFVAWRDVRFRVPVALTALLVAVALWSLSRVVGGAERYAFYWRVPIALLVVFVACAALGSRLPLDRWPGSGRAIVAVLAAVVVFSSATLSVRTAGWGQVSTAEPIARAMLAQLQRAHEPRGSVLVRDPESPLLGLERTVVNELDRRGTTVRVDAGLEFLFGYSRVATPATVDEVWYVVEGGEYVSVLTGLRGARVVWEAPALSPAQEREVRRLQRRIWLVLQRTGHRDLFHLLNSPLAGFAIRGIPGISAAEVDRVATLNALAQKHSRCRCGIVAFRSADAPTVTLPQ